MKQTLTPVHLTPFQLNAFVDAELPPDESKMAEQHLHECHECALSVIAATTLKRATVSAARQVTVPSDALSRLQQQLRPQQSAKKPPKLYAIPAARWAALAACLLLAIVLVATWKFRPSGTESAELLDQHLAVLSSAATPQVISTDRHTIKPWFQGKLPFSFNLPETLPQDAILKGANLTYLSGQPAAMLLFTVHKHEVSIFLTQRTSRSTANPQSATRSGFTICYATTPELHLAAVSNVDPKELDLLIKAVVQAQ